MSVFVRFLLPPSLYTASFTFCGSSEVATAVMEIVVVGHIYGFVLTIYEKMKQ